LARTLRIVRAHPAKNLQYVAKLDLAEQVKLETANIAASVDYAQSAALPPHSFAPFALHCKRLKFAW
jgi:hypothetical protein